MTKRYHRCALQSAQIIVCRSKIQSFGSRTQRKAQRRQLFKSTKKPAKGEVAEEEIVIDESEEANLELIEVIEEPVNEKIEGTEAKFVNLKASCVIDYTRYKCEV